MKQKFLSLCAAAMCAYTANAQMAHYYIGSNRNEVARSVKTMSDGSSIIAGYIYDLDSNQEITNADNLLLRVNPDGNILWQKQWGTDSNDMLYEMIITQNEDIVVVGTANRGTVYEHNHAAIYRFDMNGNLLFENFIRNINNNLGGETFNGVAETKSGDIVAVGSHNTAPAVIDGLISFFRPDLTEMYTENLPLSRSQSDMFTNIVADDSDKVYIIGYMYRSGLPKATTYYDQVVMEFDPYTGPLGTINWLNYYDIAYGGSDSSGVILDNDWPVKVFLRNNKLLVTSYVADGWFGAAGNIQYLFRCDKIMGLNPEVKIIRNGNTPAIHSNSSMIMPVTADDMFITNVPGSNYYDYNQTGVVSGYNVWVSRLNSYTFSALSGSKELLLSNNESVQALDINNTGGNLNGYLYMAGNAQPAGSNNNDIYFGLINPSLFDTSTCSFDTLSTVDSVLTSRVPFTVPQDSVMLNEPPVDSFVFVGLISQIQCGDSSLHNKIGTTGISINNTQENVFKIAPNPTTGAINIFYAIPGGGDGEVIITDISGRVIISNVNLVQPSGILNINLPENINRGLVICSLVVDGKVVNTSRVLVQ